MTRIAPLRMRLDLSRPLREPQWPAGIGRVPVTPARAAEAHALLEKAYEDGAGEVAPPEQWWRDLQADSEYDPALFFVAANGDGKIAGLALVWTSSFVKDLAVSPAVRRQGVGTALVMTAAREMKARGASRLDLKVKADNAPAIRLYRALGFLPVAE